MKTKSSATAESTARRFWDESKAHVRLSVSDKC